MYQDVIVFEHRNFMDKFVDRHSMRWQSTDYLTGLSTPVAEIQMYYNTLVR